MSNKLTTEESNIHSHITATDLKKIRGSLEQVTAENLAKVRGGIRVEKSDEDKPAPNM